MAKQIKNAAMMFMGCLISISVAQAAELLPPPIGQSADEKIPVVQYLNEDDLQSNLAEARKNFDATATEGGVDVHQTPLAGAPEPSLNEGSFAAPVAPQRNVPPLASASFGGAANSRLPLKNVRLQLAYEDKTLADIMADVERLVRAQAGPWSLSWRLKDENKPLLNKRVSLNAESDFDIFLSHFIDRINNLTGTRLFVKVFEASRIVVISDSF